MTRPGGRLRGIAARVCRAETMERLIDPLVADLQSEYAAAVRRGHVWRRRWVRVAGYAAFSKVVAFCALRGSLGTLHDGIEDDRQTLRRTVGFSVSGIVVATLVLLVLSLPTAHVWTRMEPSQLRLVVYLAPHTLPLAIPVGLLLGILYGLAGRAVSRRSQRAVLMISLVCSIASFATLAWMIPAGNQAFRQSYIGRDAVDKSRNEMTVGELRQEIDSYKASPMAGSSLVRGLKLSYHRRWAVSCTSLVFALFALSVVPRRPVERWIPGVAVFGVDFAYQAALWKAWNLGVSGAISPFIAAWLPNAVLVLSATALLAVASRRSAATA